MGPRLLIAACVVTLGLSSHGFAAAENTVNQDRAVEATADVPAHGGALARGLIVTMRPSARSTAKQERLRATIETRLKVDSVTSAADSMTGSVVMRFDETRSFTEVQELADELMADGTVTYAEPDLILQPTTTRSAPNDPEFKGQWFLYDGGGSSDYSIDAPSGWAYSTGSRDVVVAVLDTGWTRHPDLDAAIIDGYDFISDPDAANDGSGRDDDARDPGDWIDRSDQRNGFSRCEISDSSWHGTHVAGIIAAEKGNATGIAGVAPNVRVLAIRVMGKCGGTTSDITDAIRWAAGGSVVGVPDNPNPADVINLSLGGTARCLSAFRNAVNFATSRGVSVVVAAGNEGAPVSSSVPANCPGVISVVASNPDGKRTGWSNYGTRSMPATVTAPGESILSTLNSGRTSPARPTYARASGTSMAAPVAAGTVALLRSVGVPPGEIREALAQTTQSFGRSGSGSSCNRTSCGAGLISLERLSAFVDEPPEAPEAPEPGPDPEPDSPAGPTPLTVPGLITDIGVECRSGRKNASCSITWDEGAGASRVLYYQYRFKRGDRRWSKWRRSVDSEAQITRLPLMTMSFFEVRGVNEAGRGEVYQTAVFPG